MNVKTLKAELDKIPETAEVFVKFGGEFWLCLTSVTVFKMSPTSVGEITNQDSAHSSVVAEITGSAANWPLFRRPAK